MILDTATAEGVGADWVSVVEGRMPGLYLIETQEGERSFWYWRDRAPAREVFELSGADARMAAISQAGAVYLSGITLSLYSDVGLDRLFEALRSAREQGAVVAVDGNYRPIGWRHDTPRARAVFKRFWSLASIALPTLDDETALWDSAEPHDIIDRIIGFGASEVALKMGADGALVGGGGTREHVSVPERVEPIDTTAAGDAFSAAYLWSRLNGGSPAAAATLGHRLAGIVIRHRGAIAPREATASLVGA